MFFPSPVARVIWSIIARCFGANNIPSDLNQCWQWCEAWFPFGKKYHPWGIAAVCWAIWKSRNKACFDKEIIKSPLEILCHANALMVFWAGLYAEKDMKEMEEGVFKSGLFGFFFQPEQYFALTTFHPEQCFSANFSQGPV